MRYTIVCSLSKFHLIFESTWNESLWNSFDIPPCHWKGTSFGVCSKSDCSCSQNTFIFHLTEKAKRTSSLVEDDIVSSSSAKKKKNKEQNHITEESFLESPKHKKNKRKADVAETPNEVSDKYQKRDSPKKIKEKERHKVDLTQSRFEPKAERITIGEQCLIQSPKKRKREVVEKQGNSKDSPFTSNEKSPRKRKTDVVEIQGNNEESPLMSSKKKKKRKSSDTGSPESALLEETIPRSKSDKDSCLEVKNMDSIKRKKDESGHESEPEKSRKKKKHSKMKTGWFRMTAVCEKY